MKKYTSLFILVGSALANLIITFAVGWAVLRKTDDKIVLGERTSLFRPYIDVAGTSTARTALTAGTSTPSSAGAYIQFIDTTAVGTRGLLVRRVIGQTANLLEAQNESGAAIWFVGADGSVSSTGATSTGHIVPSVNNTYDVGRFGFAWRDIYASNSLLVGSGSASATLSSSGNLTLTGSILPASNNSSDLGAYGTAFNELFASGSLAIGAPGAQTVTSTFTHGLTLAQLGGNVGIGNASPRNLFHVGPSTEATAAGTPGITIMGDGNDPGIIIRDATNNSEVVLFARGATGGQFGTQTAHNLLFQTNNTTQWIMNTAGDFSPNDNNSTDVGAYSTSLRTVYASTSLIVGSGAGVTINTSGVNVVDGASSSTLSRSGNILTSNAFLPDLNNGASIGTTGTAFMSIYASTTLILGKQASTTTLNIASNSASSAVGQGTCLVLRATNGPLVYVTVTSTPSPSWSLSTASCE